MLAKKLIPTLPTTLEKAKMTGFFKNFAKKDAAGCDAPIYLMQTKRGNIIPPLRRFRLPLFLWQ